HALERIGDAWLEARRRLALHRRRRSNRHGRGAHRMTALQSRLDLKAKDFAQNAQAMDKAVADLGALLKQIELGGDEAARKRHTERGKLLPRARVEALLDKGKHFFELSPLAAHGVYDDPVPAAGLITGIGEVNGQDCVI